MIPKYAYDLLVIALLLIVILLVSMKKKKELFSNSTAPAPAVEKYPYNNKLRLVDGEYPDVENELQQKYVDYYQGDGTYKRIPLKSLGNPKDLSGILIYLCSNSSSYVNGSNIIVDGGWSAW